MIKKKWIENIKKVFVYLLLIIIAFIFIFPIFWLGITSIKPRFLTFQNPPVWIFEPTFQHYENVLLGTQIAAGGAIERRAISILPYLQNSLFVCTISTIACVLLVIPTAYAFARFKLGEPVLPYFILSFRMFPPTVMALPLFLLMRLYLGLYDTPWSLIIVYTTGNIAFATWMLRAFIREVPIDLEEAAMVDGCSRKTAFFRILLPLITPGIAATFVLSFVFSWNEFLYALILSSETTKTITVGLSSFIIPKGVMFGPLTAAGFVCTLPLILLAFYIQKYIVRGLTFGAVKGV